MTTLVEYMILSGAENRPPMLDKDLYDSWKSIMELYVQNREHERMILESVKHGPLIWPIIEENGVTRTKKYAELSATEKFQADCDMKAINIILQVNQQTHLAEFSQIDSGLAVPVFKQGDDPIDAINKMMSFLSTIITSSFPSTNNQLRNSSNPRQQATIHDGRVTIQPLQGRQNSYATGTSAQELILQEQEGIIQYPNPKRKRDATWFREKVLLVEAQGNGKVLTKEELEFLADPGIAKAKAVLMANLSSYGLDVLSEVPISDNTNNDMLNQSVQEMSYSKPSHFVEHLENEMHSDSNIISYSQYLIESQIAAVQDTNSSAQQDALILSVFEQLLNQVTNCNKVNNDNIIANETLSAELERYKEREKNAQFADFEKEINNLKQTLSEQSKEKELLTKTFNVFKNKSKEKEAKNIDTEIALEKKFKELDNIKAQQIRPMLYAKETNVISIADFEETLMLEEESQSKMLLKQNFGKRFVPQQELSDEQALHPTIDQSASSPVKIEAPRELPKISLMEVVVQQSEYFCECEFFCGYIEFVNYVEIRNKCLELEAELIKQNNMVEKDEYNRLSKRFSELEQHCIYLDIAMQLNKKFFQKNNTSVNQTELLFDQLFELNNLKAELQAKDMTIKKLKAHIKRVNETSTSESVKKYLDEIETINIELEHRVTSLIAEN
ncbi:hypothetical protein Tco_0912369 [Tanacetum coccineum]